MKSLFLLTLFITTSAFADFVYMRENADGKTIQWVKDGLTKTIPSSAAGTWALYPDITVDGGEVIFAEGKSEKDLYLTYKHLESNLIQRFYPVQKGMVLHPKFSKNGQYIFYSAPGPAGKNTIYFYDRRAEIEAQGEGQLNYHLQNARMLDATEESYFPRPSSDGNFVVYQRNTNGKKEIVFYDRVSKEKKIIAEGMSPALSFDERLIAFTAKSKGNWNVFVYERTSGETLQVTTDEKDEMAPTFLPDNSIVFASNKSGRFGLYQAMNRRWKTVLVDENADFYSPQFTGEVTFKQTQRASFLGNARSSFGTTVHDGKVYMAGGHQGLEHTYPKESFSDAFMVYDIATNSWKELPPRPVQAHGFQIVAHGNYIYAFGGFAYSDEHKPRWKSLKNIDRFDIKANKWETIGELLVPRSSNVAVVVEEKVYLVAGWNSTPKHDGDKNGVFLDSIEVFDLKSEKSEFAPYKLSHKRRALTGLSHNGEIILIGGIGEGASHFDLMRKVTALNPRTGAERELTPLPFATFAPAAEVIGNELFVFGGMFKTGEMSYEYVSHIYGMDLKEKTWRHTGRYLKETKGFSQVFKMSDNTVGILGGHHYSENADAPVKTFETFSF